MIQQAPTDHSPLAEPMTISFWLWNYFYAIKDGEYFHDLASCVAGLAVRGFNTVRVDAGTGLCHTAAGERRGVIEMHEPFPGFSTLRQMDPRTDPRTQGGCQVDVLEKVIELFTLAQRFDIRVILSSWFYLHTFWFVDDELVEEFFGVPVAERFRRFAVDTDRLLAELKARGLQGQIAFVEIQNEFDGLFYLWGLDKLGTNDEEKRQVLDEFRRWHEEALAFLQARHPDLLFAIDTCHSGIDRAMLPRNAEVWNYHMYYAWGVYTDVFESPVYDPDFDFAQANAHPVVGPFLRRPLLPIEDVRACRKYLPYVGFDWPTRVWLFNNLDAQALPELEHRLADRLVCDLDMYKQRIDTAIQHAADTCAALFPQIALVVGEGTTYCAHPDMRWEEESAAYWELVDYATRRFRDEGYWGCVPRTNSGPEDPSWREYPERLRAATARFLER